MEELQAQLAAAMGTDGEAAVLEAVARALEDRAEIAAVERTPRKAALLREAADCVRAIKEMSGIHYRTI